MRIGVLLAPGESMRVLGRSGQADRLITYYLPVYESAYDEVVVFSYENESLLLSKKTRVEANRFSVHRFLYFLIMPFITRLKTCNVVRVMQATSILPALIAKWFFGAKVVATFGYDYGAFARTEGNLLVALIIPWYLRLLRFADVVIVTTSGLASIARRYTGMAKIVVLPNGVDISAFTPTRKVRGPPWEILYVGRLDPAKNIGNLMRGIAASSLASYIHLTCVGSGSMRDALVDLSKDLKIAVDFTGTIEHTKLPAYYARAHLFALVSLVEGHPKALLEALSAGLPCLVSGVAGTSVGIKHGVQGFIVNDDTYEIARALEGLCTKAPLAKMAKRARALATSSYNVKKLLKQEMEILTCEAL